MYTVPKHIWRTAAGDLVPHGHLDAAFLAYAAGTEMTDHDAAASGVLGVYPAEDSDPELKSVGGHGDKSVTAHGDKGTSGSQEEPKKSASKTDWVEYAVSKGADRADAESATRDELAVVWGSSK